MNTTTSRTLEPNIKEEKNNNADTDCQEECENKSDTPDHAKPDRSINKPDTPDTANSPENCSLEKNAEPDTTILNKNNRYQLDIAGMLASDLGLNKKLSVEEMIFLQNTDPIIKNIKEELANTNNKSHEYFILKKGVVCKKYDSFNPFLYWLFYIHSCMGDWHESDLGKDDVSFTPSPPCFFLLHSYTRPKS